MNSRKTTNYEKNGIDAPSDEIVPIKEICHCSKYAKLNVIVLLAVVWKILNNVVLSIKPKS